VATRTNKQTNIKKGRINLQLCRPFLTHTLIITLTKGWRGIIDRFTSHLGPPMWLPHVQYLLPRNAFLKKGSQTQGRGNLFETGKSLHPHLHVLAILFPPLIPSHPIHFILSHHLSSQTPLHHISSLLRFVSS